MSNSRTFNGYASYETWALALHLDNNEGDHAFWRERAVEHYQAAKETHSAPLARHEARSTLACELKDWLDAIYDEVYEAAVTKDKAVPSEAVDLLVDVGTNTNRTTIDYLEIAGGWLDEVMDGA